MVLKGDHSKPSVLTLSGNINENDLRAPRNSKSYSSDDELQNGTVEKEKQHYRSREPNVEIISYNCKEINKVEPCDENQMGPEKENRSHTVHRRFRDLLWAPFYKANWAAVDEKGVVEEEKSLLRVLENKEGPKTKEEKSTREEINTKEKSTKEDVCNVSSKTSTQTYFQNKKDNEFESDFLSEIKKPCEFPAVRYLLSDGEYLNMFKSQLESIRMHIGNSFNLLYHWKLIHYVKATKKYKLLGSLSTKQDVEELVALLKDENQLEEITMLLKENNKLMGGDSCSTLALQIPKHNVYTIQKILIRLICVDNFYLETPDVEQAPNLYGLSFNQKEQYCVVKLYLKDLQTDKLTEMLRPRLPTKLQEFCDTAKLCTNSRKVS